MAEPPVRALAGETHRGKGLRPRDAAYLIGAFWAIAVVAFGAVERVKAKLEHLRPGTGDE